MSSATPKSVVPVSHSSVVRLRRSGPGVDAYCVVGLAWFAAAVLLFVMALTGPFMMGLLPAYFVVCTGLLNPAHARLRGEA